MRHREISIAIFEYMCEDYMSAQSVVLQRCPDTMKNEGVAAVQNPEDISIAEIWLKIWRTFQIKIIHSSLSNKSKRYTALLEIIPAVWNCCTALSIEMHQSIQMLRPLALKDINRQRVWRIHPWLDSILDYRRNHDMCRVQWPLLSHSVPKCLDSNVPETPHRTGCDLGEVFLAQGKRFVSTI